MKCYKVELATAFGGHTLVGSHGEFPRKFGNCFSLKVEQGFVDIINFKFENLEELIRRGLSWPIKVRKLDVRRALVVDERIPDHWYTNRYCEVCSPERLLNQYQIEARRRAEARGDRIVHPNGMIQMSMQPNPIFDYVGEKKVDLSKIVFKMEIKETKQFGEDGKEI